MHVSDRTLEGRVAIVTGAATGLGLGIARSLAARGAILVLNDVDGDRLEEAAGTFTDVRVQTVVADIGDESAVGHLVAAAEAIDGAVAILVNNAGVQVAKPFLDHSVAEWDRVIGINLRATFLTMHAAAPGMIRAGGGAIVNLSSVAAFHTTTPHVAYAASKAAVSALTRDTAHELARHGIRVNAIAPGPIETPMTSTLDPALLAAITRSVPVGRWGRPADIGEAVAFLVGDAAGYVTGVTLPVAGGADLQVAYGASSG